MFGIPLILQAEVRADGPADNQAANVRPIPPVGNELSPDAKASLTQRCKALRSQWGKLMQAETEDRIEALACEVLVFPRAVELAIEFHQFYQPRDAEIAMRLLKEAERRLEIVRSGGTWEDVVGLADGRTQQLIVGGFSSKIDGSYQPYALVVPRGLTVGDVRPRRLDVWFHGRGETLSEIAFLSKQQTNAGQYTPEDVIVLHPYGRYSNAFKFAGEIDVLEALDHVRRHLPVDSSRISVRGFSMGGAGCWQFATHYADRWFAANPGAGFSETPEFLRFFQGENVNDTAPDYQKKLWQWYDCPPWAINLSHCPTIAYSGEIDKQKQAADIMQVALERVGIDMQHVIGPKTAHKIHPDSKVEIDSRMHRLASQTTVGVPHRVVFTTMMLRYHRMHWIDVQGLRKHWTPATVTATLRNSQIDVSTSNVTRLRLVFDSGQWPSPPRGVVDVVIDGETLSGQLVGSDRSWECHLIRRDGKWQFGVAPDSLLKRPELQGPIDDAFMDSFLFVLPSGKSRDKAVQKWVEQESQHAMLHWRKHFRGDVRSKLDTELSEADIQNSNLILFGDPMSNTVIHQIVNRLPVSWGDDSIGIGNFEVPSQGHVPILIYPNPLNPKRYIVLNSGFTFREYDYLNNARQTPKLPDWALVDLRSGATSQSPGIIKQAGFFDETWNP